MGQIVIVYYSETGIILRAMANMLAKGVRQQVPLQRLFRLMVSTQRSSKARAHLHLLSGNG